MSEWAGAPFGDVGLWFFVAGAMVKVRDNWSAKCWTSPCNMRLAGVSFAISRSDHVLIIFESWSTHGRLVRHCKWRFIWFVSHIWLWLCAAGALFGHVGVSLFVAGAILSDVGVWLFVAGATNFDVAVCHFSLQRGHFVMSGDFLHHHHRRTTDTQPATTKTPPPWTAEGWCKQKLRFGHRIGWSPCAHSMAYRHILWRIVFFPFETSGAGLSGSRKKLWRKVTLKLKLSISWPTWSTCLGPFPFFG